MSRRSHRPASRHLHHDAGRVVPGRGHRRRLTLIVPIALFMAACGSDSDTSSPAVSDTSSSTIAVAVGDVDSDVTGEAADDTSNETTATATSTTTTTTVVPDPAQCVPGIWELRAQAFFDQIVALTGGGGAMRHLGGRHLATFNPDGTSEGLREAWSFEVASPEGSLITTVDATDTGTWAVDGDTITVSSQEQTFEASLEMLVGGVRQPFPFAPPDAVQTEVLGGVGPYTCEGDVLTITLTEDGLTITNTWDRITG